MAPYSELKSSINKGFRRLSNPEAELSKKKGSFEDDARTYLTLLSACAILAVAVTFFFGFGRAVFLSIFLNASIEYPSMLNYLVSKIVAVIFFYLFAGTFLLFLFGVIIDLFAKMKYVDLFRVIFFSATPILLFGWLPIFAFHLLIWSGFLFIKVIQYSRGKKSSKKGSINERD